MTPQARRIDRVYRAASEEDRRAGQNWYRDASAMIRSIATARGGCAERVAGIVAALSPGVSWEHNIAAARRVLDGHRDRAVKYQGYRANLDKAQRIADGEDAREVLGGFKVRAFFRLLLDPARHADAVCVDTIAATAAHYGLAPVVWQKDYKRVVLPGPRIDRYAGYEAICAAYRQVAWRVNVPPHEVQATVWLALKRLNNRTEGKAVQ